MQSRLAERLLPMAKDERKRIAADLNAIDVLTQVDPAGHAVYGSCWVEAERKLAETPSILKTPAGNI